MESLEEEFKTLSAHLSEARERGAPREIIAEIQYQRNKVGKKLNQQSMPEPVDERRARQQRRREERDRNRQFQQQVL